MQEVGIVQNDPTRGMSPLDQDPIEKDLVAQNLIVEWANKKYSERTDSVTFSTQLGIKELDLWHWVSRLADRIRKIRAARIEAEYGERVDRKVAEKAESGSAKHAGVYYKYVEGRKNEEQQQATNIQVNVGIPD